MADLTRAEDLVLTIERDDALRAEVAAAPTTRAKRQILDRYGFKDVGLDDMRAYVESKGGTLVIPEGGRELTEQELAAVAGGLTEGEAIVLGLGVTAFHMGFAIAVAAVA